MRTDKWNNEINRLCDDMDEWKRNNVYWYDNKTKEYVDRFASKMTSIIVRQWFDIDILFHSSFVNGVVDITCLDAPSLVLRNSCKFTSSCMWHIRGIGWIHRYYITSQILANEIVKSFHLKTCNYKFNISIEPIMVGKENRDVGTNHGASLYGK